MKWARDLMRSVGVRRQAEQEDRGAADAARSEAPPFVNAVAVLQAGMVVQRRIGAVALLALVALVIQQQRTIGSLSEQLRAKEYLVVPGAADFLPVRANMIPDASVVRFAEYFVERMVSVSERTLAGRFEELRRFMAPELEERLRRELGDKAALLSDVRGAEIWAPVGRAEIYRFTGPDGRSYFEAKLAGQVERFALQRTLGSSKEVVTLTFRTRSALSADDPWIFEVVDLIRRSSAEQAELERSQASAAARAAGGAR